DLGIAFRLQGGEKLRVRGALITSYNDSARGTHFRAGASGDWMSYRGKSRVHFRGSRDGSGPFIPARRAVDDGNDNLRRTTGGGDASAGDGDALPTAADCYNLDWHFAATPDRRNATVNCSHARAECDAAEFRIKYGSAIPGGEACSWQTWVRFQSL